MKETILFVLGLIFAVLGVVSIFDARDLSNKLFGIGDQNEATAGLKILGFFISMIGALIIYFR